MLAVSGHLPSSDVWSESCIPSCPKRRCPAAAIPISIWKPILTKWMLPPHTIYVYGLHQASLLVPMLEVLDLFAPTKSAHKRQVTTRDAGRLAIVHGHFRQSHSQATPSPNNAHQGSRYQHPNQIRLAIKSRYLPWNTPIRHPPIGSHSSIQRAVLKIASGTKPIHTSGINPWHTLPGDLQSQ